MKFKLEFKQNYQFLGPLLKNIVETDVKIVEGNADLHVALAHEVTDLDLNSGKKFLILEKRDGGTISKRAVLSHPAVVRYVKQYKYTDVDFCNLPSANGRFFTRFISDDAKWSKLKNVDESNYKKIFLGWNFLHYDRMQPFIGSPPPGKNRKTIDIFFAGTIYYIKGDENSGKIITQHRINCLNAIKKIKGINIELIEGRAIDNASYHKLMSNSKIAISPWGWGEVGYRDYEALLSGCLLVKPKTDFVESTCGIFEKPYSTWVDPSFSNLKDTIEDLLDNYSNHQNLLFEQRNDMLKKRSSLKSIITEIFTNLK